MNACNGFAPLLVERELGLLEGTQGRELEAHLAGCEACRARATGSVAAVLEALRAPALPMSEGWDALAERIEADRLRRREMRISLSCAFCHDGLERSTAAFCASCLAAHHADCFRQHGRCCAPGCSETRVVHTTPGAPASRPRRRHWGLLAGPLVAAAALTGWQLGIRDEGKPVTLTHSGFAGEQVSIHCSDADVREVIQLLAAKGGGKNVIVQDDVRGRVTLDLRDMHWLRALYAVAKSIDCEVLEEHEGLVLRVVRRESIETVVQSELILMRCASPKQAANVYKLAMQLVEPYRRKDVHVQIEYDDDTKTIIFTGPRPLLQQVRGLVERYDVRDPTSENQSAGGR